jgi:hypothetical protein
MSPGRRFEHPPALPHPVVAAAVERGIVDPAGIPAAADALVGIALVDLDREFIEHCCLRVAGRAAPGHPLLGLAGLCLGHTARRFGQVSEQARAAAESLAARARADPADVDGRALDGLDDIHWFTGRGRPGHGQDREGSWPARRTGSWADPGAGGSED